MANNIIPINPYGSNGQVTGMTEMRAKSIKMERGGLKDTGAMDYTIASYNGNIRTAMLVKRNDATRIAGKTLTGFTVYEYEEDFSFIQKTDNVTTLEFDSDCRYFKIAKATMNNYESAIFLFDGDIKEVYNVQMESGTYTDESLTRLYSETLVFEVDEKICTTARLLLPSNYSIIGKKVPLIIWCGCDGSYPSWNYPIDYVGSQPSSITAQLQYLVSEGFAVMNVYPWGSYNNINFPSCGMSGAVPVPVTLRVYEKAVEYVTTRFNISDTNIFMSSWSGSGKLSAYYAIHKPTFNLRSIYAFSPVVDGGCWRMCETLSGATGFRGATNSEMRFEGTAEQIRQYKEDSNSMSVEDALAFKKLNAEKFAKFSSIKWQNLTGSYLKDGVLHEHTIEDKVEDSMAWGEAWRASQSSPIGLRGSVYNRYELAITGDGAPITIIGAEDDLACPYLAMEEFIIQLQNGGAEARIITLPNSTGGHSAPITGNAVTVGNSQIPYGWWYMAQDIKSRFLKQQ